MSNSRSKTVLVMLLSLSLLATGCSAQWIKVALADLPVLLQMALNIGTLVTTLQSGQQLSASEAAEIQNISNEASRDLNLLQTLYNEYEASPSSSTIQKIQNAIADINQNLPALLQAAHIVDPVISTRVTAAVNLILSTVNSFATLIPQSVPPATAQKVTRRAIAIPHASDLKKQWKQQVCGPTGKAALDNAFANCEVK
jgi:hypothetical protein